MINEQEGVDNNELSFSSEQIELLRICQQLAREDVEGCLAAAESDPFLLDKLLRTPTSNKVTGIEDVQITYEDEDDLFVSPEDDNNKKKNGKILFPFKEKKEKKVRNQKPKNKFKRNKKFINSNNKNKNKPFEKPENNNKKKRRIRNKYENIKPRVNSRRNSPLIEVKPKIEVREKMKNNFLQGERESEDEEKGEKEQESGFESEESEEEEERFFEKKNRFNNEGVSRRVFFPRNGNNIQIVKKNIKNKQKRKRNSNKVGSEKFFGKKKKVKKEKKLEEGFNLRLNVLEDINKGFDYYNKQKKHVNKKREKKKVKPKKSKIKKKGRVLKIGPSKEVKRKRESKKKQWKHIDKIRAMKLLKQKMFEKRLKKEEEIRQEQERDRIMFEKMKNRREQERIREREREKEKEKLEEKDDIVEEDENRKNVVTRNIVPETKKKDREPSSIQEPSVIIKEKTNKEVQTPKVNVIKKIESREEDNKRVTSDQLNEMKKVVKEEEDMLRIEEEINQAKIFDLFENFHEERMDIEQRLKKIREGTISVGSSIESFIQPENHDNERYNYIEQKEVINLPINNIEKSVPLLEKEEIFKIKEYKRMFHDYVKRETGILSSETGAKRSQIIDLISEGIIDDVIEEVAKEMSNVGDEAINLIFENEFKL